METKKGVELYDEAEDKAEFGGKGSSKDEVSNLHDSPELGKRQK